MKLIVGLGNPGQQYEGTRHNAGYYFVDKLSANQQIASDGESVKFSFEKKFEAKIAKTSKDGEDILLVKPETFMNLSGQSVQRIMQFYKASPEDLIIINDDIDLPLGQARIRHEGGSAGQKGLQNIIDTIDTDSFTRIRIGVGEYEGNMEEHDKPSDIFDAADFVLSKFADREVKIMEKIVSEIIDYILPYIGSKSEIIPARTINALTD